MAQDWFYKLLGEETGPVTFTALRDLAQEGHLTSDDEIRTSTSSWKLASQVPELFSDEVFEEPELATDMDLDMLLAPSSSMPVPLSAKRQALLAARAAAAAPIEEWYYRLLGQEMGPASEEEILQLIKDSSLQATDTVRLGKSGTWMSLQQTAKFSSVVNDMQQQPEWYCQVLGQELGPMTFDELQHMAKSRSLNPDDDVRHASTTDWSKADRTRGLKFPKQSAVVASAAPASTMVPFGDAARKKEWYCEVLGQEMGPISFNELLKSVQDGKLTMEDRARRGKSGQWSAVMDVPGLVSMEQKSAYLAAKVEARRPKPAPPVAAAATTPRTQTEPATSTASPPPPPPSPAAGMGYGSMASAGRPAGFPSNFKSPKKGGSSSGGGLADTLKQLDPKVLAAIAAVVLIVGGYFGMAAMGIQLFAPAGLAEYVEVKKIWSEVQKTNSIKPAPKPDDWAALKKKHGKRVKELHTQVEAQGPGSSKRLLQLMLFCTKDHLPQIMDSGDPKRFTMMQKDMKEAAKLASAAKKK